MDEKNINISKSEEEFLEIMENRSHITADQLHNLKAEFNLQMQQNSD